MLTSFPSASSCFAYDAYDESSPTVVPLEFHVPAREALAVVCDEGDGLEAS